MQLQTVEITNIRAVDYLKFQAGALTIIRAHNGCGKTSVIDGVKAVFEGGHDPTLLRQGAKKGSIILTLDEGTTIEKAVTAKSSTLTVKTAEGTIVPAPAKFVDSLAKGFAFDPLAFITAPKADRAKFLASAMPIAVSKRDIVAAVDLRPLAGKVADLIPASDKAVPYTLPQLLQLRKEIYEERTGTAKQRKTQEGGIDALRKTLPANWKPEGDPDQITADAQDTLNDATAKLREIGESRDSEVVKLDQINSTEEGKISVWESEQIDNIRQDATAKRAMLSSAYKAIRLSAYHSLDAELEAAQTAVTAATSDLNAARETAKGWAVQAATAATIQQYQKDLRETSADEDVLTAAIEAIDAAKQKAMATTPIPEITTIDGEVYVAQPGLDEPVPFDAVNTQQQWMLALKIASLGAGDLGLMCVDGSESIVGENFAKFQSACVDSGFQVIATRADADYKAIDVETVNA